MFMGIVLGLLAAFGISRMLGNLVYGIDATDPLTFWACRCFSASSLS